MSEPKPYFCSTALILIAAASVVFCAACPVAAAQDTSTLLVLRPIPAKSKGKQADPATPPVLQSDVSGIKIGGKPAAITAWTPLLKGPTTLQLVVLLDPQQRIGLYGQFDAIKNLFNSLPPNVEIAVGYMLQGKTKIDQIFTADRTLAGNALHLQTEEEAASPKNNNGNIYYCLEDLAVNWPDPDPKKVRAVLLFTDGIGRSASVRSSGATIEGTLQLNPDVDVASQFLIRAGIAPFPFYYVDLVPLAGQKSGSGYIGNLDQLTAETNGQALYDGPLPPRTFGPLLYRFYSILDSEAVVTVAAKGSGLKTLDIKSSREDIKVAGPNEVMIGNGMPKK